MFSKEEVSQLIETIWATTVDLTVEPVEDSPGGEGQERLTGCVHITGGWNGALTVDCSAKLAKEASARLFDTTPEEANAEDVHDTLSELTNMTGGNLKAMLAQSTSEALNLSLPSITAGKDFRLSLPRTREVLEISYLVAGEPMVVRLLQEDPKARGTASIRMGSS